MPTQQASAWRHLAEQASVEMNPDKLATLVEELTRVLDEQEAAERQRRLGLSSGLRTNFTVDVLTA